MKVGDKVSRVPECLYGNDSQDIRQLRKRKFHDGTIVYIHPQGRYYTVEFDLGLGKVRESYTK